MSLRRRKLFDQSPLRNSGVVYVSLASKPSNCLPSPLLSNITIHSSSPVSFSVLHPPIILHCHHSLALARIGHAVRHFVNITMTTNVVSGECPTVNHDMQCVSQSYANLKNPTVNVTRFPYEPIAMAVTNNLLFGGVDSRPVYQSAVLRAFPVSGRYASQPCRMIRDFSIVFLLLISNRRNLQRDSRRDTEQNVP